MKRAQFIALGLAGFSAIALPDPAQAFPWYAAGDNIRGASLMSSEERQKYVAKLLAMQSFDECRKYVDEHSLEIEKRAKAQNTPLPPVKGDPCEVMRQSGKVR